MSARRNSGYTARNDGKSLDPDPGPFGAGIMSAETCGVCGGDGRIGNSFGLITSCSACYGSGKRSSDASGIRDVTKTKPSHHRQSTKREVTEKQKWPMTFEGGQ